MHTLVVTMTTDPDRREEVERHLREDVISWATRQPGFVSGEWLLSETGESGMGFVVFDSADAATRAAAGPKGSAYDEGGAWNIASVTIYAPVASA